ncbi:hypothetical protein PCASD_26342 [Puccinia coronata f. sp. avenae]|uniref:Uncharacterized protein n=1 Tax=Puccinia coronata f. sp. avenae TaxID=200324 RepID=A0A2N5TLB5_9BASI|nr:hypothetical protein PCASD_26342 [Puccinia coronata f. sp. avenae]
MLRIITRIVTNSQIPEVSVPALPVAVSDHQVPEPEFDCNDPLAHSLDSDRDSKSSTSGCESSVISKQHSRTRDAPNPGNSSARSFSGSQPLTRSATAKRKHATGMRDWPHPSELSIDQLKEYLDQFDILYQSHDRPPLLIAKYKLLRVNCLGVLEPRAQTKRGQKSGLSSDREAGPSDRRRQRTRQHTSPCQRTSAVASKSDFNFVPSQVFNFLPCNLPERTQAKISDKISPGRVSQPPIRFSQLSAMMPPVPPPPNNPPPSQLN